MGTWLKKLASFVPNLNHLAGQGEKLGQGAQAFERKAKASLFTNEGEKNSSLELESENIKQQNLKLLRLVQEEGPPAMDRVPLRYKIRKKVKEGLVDAYDVPEITDEVTERLVEAAQMDARIRKMLR